LLLACPAPCVNSSACMQPTTRRHLHTIADDGIFDSEVPAAVFASLSLNEDDSGPPHRLSL